MAFGGMRLYVRSADCSRHGIVNIRIGRIWFFAAARRGHHLARTGQYPHCGTFLIPAFCTDATHPVRALIA